MSRNFADSMFGWEHSFSVFSKPRIDLYWTSDYCRWRFCWCDSLPPSDKHHFVRKVNKTIFIEMTSTNIQIFAVWQLRENKIIAMMIHQRKSHRHKCFAYGRSQCILSNPKIKAIIGRFIFTWFICLRICKTLMNRVFPLICQTLVFSQKVRRKICRSIKGWRSV